MRKLSERELKTLTMLAADLGTAEIAEVLGISQGSIYTFVSRAKSKLGTQSLAAAVARAFALGILKPEPENKKVGLSVKAAVAVERAKQRRT